MFNNNQDETTRQTLERVMREMGLYKEPKIMHTEIGDFHVYDDDDSMSNGNMTSSVVNQNVPSYNTQNAYVPSPTYSVSATNNYQLQPTYDYNNSVPQSNLGVPQTTTGKAINQYIPDAMAQYSVPEFGKQNPNRTVYQSLTGFAENNQRWHELNPQKGSYNFVQDEYETNPLVNDCVKNDRYNTFVENMKKPDREGYGFHISDQDTNSGISKGWYNSFLAEDKNKAFVDNYPKTVNNLTQEQVDNLYCQGFYKPNHIETFNDDFTAEHIFDVNVNIGGTKGSEIIQKAYNDINKPNISTTGGIGTETVTAINRLQNGDLMRLNNQIVDRRRQYYDGNRNRDKYPGWYTRAESFRR